MTVTKKQTAQGFVGHWLAPIVSLTVLLGLSTPPAQAQTPQNPLLKIGIVQRFGRDDAKTLVVEPLNGDQLTVQFKTNDQLETFTTNQVVIDTAPVATPQAMLQEWVVLSTHRSFESAEDSAQQWRQKGIETEIAQPGDWQVWAKRDIYSTPMLRRMLVQELQTAGFSTVYVDSRVVRSLPKAAVIFNGFRYNRDIVSISTPSYRVRVIEKLGEEEETSRVYGGNLRLQPNAYGTYTLVNQVPTETYLRGVVPYEIGTGAPPTTIEAQAILARTYVLRNLRRFAVDDYELCADTQCQVYWGVSGATGETDRAIVATQGQVLTYQNELVDALYSSNAGGVTAAFSDVWNGPDRPYLQPVVDSVVGSWNLAQRPLSEEANLKAFLALETGFNEETWDTFRWQEDASLEKLAQDLRTYLQARNHPLANLTQVQRMVVTQRAASGRVQELQISTDVGLVTLKKDEVIRAIEPPLSLLFYTAGLYEQPPGSSTPQLVGYRFVGGGFGHGVGLSQTGAYNLGALGWSSDRILQFYYPGTQLQPMSDRLILWRDPYQTAPPTDSPATTP